MLTKTAQPVWRLSKLQTSKWIQHSLPWLRRICTCPLHDTVSSKISWSEPSPLVLYLDQLHRYKEMSMGMRAIN